MDKEQIISTLINLNFSRLEAEIYITLLGGRNVWVSDFQKN